jgi:hypothetical protein
MVAHRPGSGDNYHLADIGTLGEGEGVVSATVAPLAVWHQRLGHTGRRSVANGLPPLIAFICGWLLIASQVPHGLAGVIKPATFSRWDSAWYQRIALHGYRLRLHCHHWHHTARPGVHLCTSATWFPGYPLLMRAVSTTGISLTLAGVMIAWLFWYLTLLMIWLLSEPTPEGPASPWGTTTRWLCLLIAAFFPGQIYFAAVFPISMAAFGMLACCYWSARAPNRSLAAIAGLIAGSAYLPTVAVVPGLVIAAVVTKDRRARAAMCWGAGGVAAGVVAVLAYAQVSVGRWSAYFYTEQVDYGVRAHDPLTTIIARFTSFVPVPASSPLRAIAEQGLLVALLLVLALAGFAAGTRAGLKAADIVLIIAAVVGWLIPYVGGGKLSVYRDEAMMIVLVPLLRRLPAWVLAGPLLAAVWVADMMAPLFFGTVLR